MRALIARALWVTVLLAATLHAGDIPWNLEALSKPPKMYNAPDFKVEGLTALFYEGLPYKGKPTRVFAWVGLPEGACKERPVPAIVLVHGGGGTAFADWAKLWVRRGYAAIAMDNCGALPSPDTNPRPRHEHSGPPGWGGFNQVDEPLEDQWTYHAVADVILAHSLLRSFAEVDRERVGITGISWGGYLTCIASSVDSRFKFSVPVYGCGFLGDNSTWLPTFKGMGDEKSRKWLGVWDPSVYLPNAKMPMLWVTGTNDFAYPMDSLQKSYNLAKGPQYLCVRIRMPHAHGGAGEKPAEIHYFAEHICNKGPAPIIFSEQGRDGEKVWAKFSGQPARAQLEYTTATGIWKDREWKTAPAELENGRCTATLPAGTTVYYFNLADAKEHFFSTQHVEVK